MKDDSEVEDTEKGKDDLPSAGGTASGRAPITGYLRHLVRGTLVIAKWEFLQNLLSVRMLVLISIFSLVMFGGSYGFTSLLGQGTGDTPFDPSAIFSEAMGEIFVAAHVLDLDDNHTGSRLNDVVIHTFSGDGEPASDQIFKLFETWGTVVPGGVNITDGDGRSVYYNLPPAEYQVELVTRAFVSFTFSVEANVSQVHPLDVRLAPVYDVDLGGISLEKGLGDLDIESSFVEVGVIAHVVDRNGTPLEGVRIYLNERETGVTNETGTYPLKLSPGEHSISGSYSGERTDPAVQTIEEPDVRRDVELFAGLPANLGPDFVIIIVASIAGFVASLSAVVLSFDAITKEISQGSLDVLLTRPFPKESVVIGKHLGITGAMAVPFATVLLVSVWIISAVSGRWPTISVTTAFMGFMLLLISTFIALEIIISILAKTTGTAILGGIGMWVLLNVLWDAFGIAIAKTTGISQIVVSQYTSLFNPSNLFIICLSIVSTDALIETFGSREIANYINLNYAFGDWVFFSALSFWAVVSLVIAVVIFKRKQTF